MSELREKWLFAIYDKLLIGLLALVITLFVQKSFDNSKFVSELRVQNTLAKAALKSGLAIKTFDRALDSSQQLLTFIVALEPFVVTSRLGSMQKLAAIQGELYLLQASTNSLLGTGCSTGKLHATALGIDRFLLNASPKFEPMSISQWPLQQSALVKEVTTTRKEMLDCFQRSLISLTNEEVTAVTSPLPASAVR